MKMLKTKHFRRLAVFLAMIAPAVYLFGSLFSALTGAHGTQVFAATEYGVVSVDVPLSPGDIDVDTGEEIVTPNAYTISGYQSVPDGADSVVVDVLTPDVYHVVRIYFYDDDFSYLGTTPMQNQQPSNFSILADTTYFRLRLYYQGPLQYSCSYYFGGAEAYYSAVGYSDYVFGQFFAKDNFLVRWGENAISENPNGFAPFGAFWRYLDMNVLHLSNDQVGLMGYGYIYYACHVLLFDIGFILVTFFLDFIQKIADKFTGGE